ncbi:MAG TPA: glutamate--cysteine ligase [Nocardioidaceae bacterium]|nr:glutamate--cysteine ligase [Nocardioidaceae bacterium]
MDRTVGVEEEFLLFASGSTRLAPLGDVVAEEASGRSEGQFEHELKREQAELGTKPYRDLGDLEVELRLRRRELADSAADRDARLAALATCPVEEAHSVTPEERYHRMTETFGRVSRLQLTCGQHVHVGIESSEEGVAVIDRIAPWLSVLVALSANSPYLAGQDSDYASYRTVLWGQWPSTGLGDPFGDVTTYDAATGALLSSGAAIDDGMLYLDARLSRRFPTVEVRVADVTPYAEDAVTVAALCRAMVDAAAQDWRVGAPPPTHRGEALRAARWRAARFGLSDRLYDVGRNELVPAWELVGRLQEWVAAAASPEDRNRVADGVERIRARGSGADLQRASFSTSGDLADVIADVVRQTAT